VFVKKELTNHILIYSGWDQGVELETHLSDTALPLLPTIYRIMTYIYCQHTQTLQNVIFVSLSNTKVVCTLFFNINWTFTSKAQAWH